MDKFKKFKKPEPITVEGMITRTNKVEVKGGNSVYFNTLGVQGEEKDHYFTVSTDQPLEKGGIVRVTGSYSIRRTTNKINGQSYENERIYVKDASNDIQYLK